MDEFERDDRCLRLVCRHVYHVHCWNDLLIAEERPVYKCPACRGGARVIARFRFIPDHTEPNSRGTSADCFQSAFPWMPAPGAQPEGCYHSSTQLPGGQLSIMVEIGAWTNLAGTKTGRAIAQAAVAAGHQPQQRWTTQPLSIMGVGIERSTQGCCRPKTRPV